MNRLNLLLAILLCMPAAACGSAAQAAPSNTPRVERDQSRALHTTHSSKQVVQIGADDDSPRGDARPLRAEPDREAKGKAKATTRRVEGETRQAKPRKEQRERDPVAARGQSQTPADSARGHSNNDRRKRLERDPSAKGKPRKLHSTGDRACKIRESYAARSRNDDAHPDSAGAERKRRLPALRADRQCKKHRAAEQRKSAQGSGNGTH